MSVLNTLLLATDFSEGSVKAAAVARGLAQLAKGRLYVINVVALLRDSYAWNSILMPSSVNSEELDHGILKEAQSELNRFVAQYLQPAGDAFSVENKVLPGAAVPQVILREAEIVQADLIVLGTHGRSGLQRALLGSVAEAVLRSSPIPVLTTRG